MSRQIAFTLAALSGVVPALSWLGLVGAFALDRAIDSDGWFVVMDVANVVMLAAHVFALILLSVSLCLSLSARGRDLWIMLLEGLVAGNLLVPQLITWLFAAI